MSLSRSLRLTWTHNKQFFQKLRYDLGRELVVLISSAVLLGLFAYIFRDFINDKLKAIPPSEQASIARGFATFLLLLTGPLLASPIHRLWRDEPSLRSFANRSGENPRTISGFLVIQTFIILVFGFGIYWQFIGRPWGHWDVLQIALWQSASLCLGIFRLVLHKEKTLPSFKPLLNDQPSTRIETLIAWRWKQIFLRNRIAKLCLMLAFLLQIFGGALFALKAPFPLAVLIAMGSGILIACAPSFQLEEDMRAIWFERQVGSSHAEYVAVYQKICQNLALVFGLSVLLISFATRGIAAPTDTLKLFAITALFPLLLPAVMFQIAPERPVLQIMTITLIGIFLGTAIFAHWASVALVPIALVYAKQYQQNNFYRS
ncbi:MAG: hypothetical protein H7249_02035 [Chitinophagaceae bacterium]|nr:hypothetical protein [Oligoflexus sp.]